MQELALGKHQELRVTAKDDDGLRLDGGSRELFLPADLAPEDAVVGEPIEVFVYTDHEGEPQPTTLPPAGEVGEVAVLRCVSVTRAGAYLDWGLPKDLFVPMKEQERPLVEGQRYVAAICLDDWGTRLIAATQIGRRLDYNVPNVRVGDRVDVLVFGIIDAGTQVVVNRRYRGLIHRAKIERHLPVGSSHVGYVGHIRDDNRIDIELSRRGAQGVHDAREVLLAALERSGGKLALHDRTSPEEIQRTLGISKKAFKRAAGSLYKARRIVIRDDGIELVPPAGEARTTPKR